MKRVGTDSNNYFYRCNDGPNTAYVDYAIQSFEAAVRTLDGIVYILQMHRPQIVGSTEEAICVEILELVQSLCETLMEITAEWYI